MSDGISRNMCLKDNTCLLFNISIQRISIRVINIHFYPTFIIPLVKFIALFTISHTNLLYGKIRICSYLIPRNRESLNL
jgi:hypothetical protein